MKTKYSIYILTSLAVLFSFTSCVKDDLATWVSVEADKTEVAVNETVTFKVSGNAETYVVYSGDTGHDFTKSILVVTAGQKIDQEQYVLTQANLDAWTPVLTADINTYNALPANVDSQIDAATVFADLSMLVNKPYYFDTAYQKLMAIFNLSGGRKEEVIFKTKSYCETSVTTYFSNRYVLSQAKLDTWSPILTTEINAWNAVPSNTPIDKLAVLAKLQSLVNNFYYFDEAKELLGGILSPLKTDTDCAGLVSSYFTKNTLSLAPVGGFSTGVALNRNNLTYSYKFTTPGTYTVTILGTKLSDKNYSGSGYIDDRTSSASEYDYRRNTATVTIVVK